jgi:serine/threonine protein kinase
MMNGGGNIMLSKTTNPRWTAPEVIRDSQIGPAGDVYSFAIIMWEVLTWQQPYEEMMSVQVRPSIKFRGVAIY